MTFNIKFIKLYIDGRIDELFWSGSIIIISLMILFALIARSMHKNIEKLEDFFSTSFNRNTVVRSIRAHKRIGSNSVYFPVTGSILNKYPRNYHNFQDDFFSSLHVRMYNLLPNHRHFVQLFYI